jgi:hypothetical protein
MNDPLGNPLMVEMEYLLAQHEIFEQRGPACAGFQAVLIVGNADTLVCRQMARRIVRTLARNLLMGFAAVTLLRLVCCLGRHGLPPHGLNEGLTDEN